ncbi:hypothetical protein [Sinorhizobium meliloti]|uniref:hypothetical protein n=1 Tax=Rhizobium meliloti TaxID=382 RepID=UPI000FDCC1EC|nr:hypothetical protein [Sinorhizobium meliloti]RVQ23032.1 hypothetical protein CN096_01325 [Sinorhizobium meliloti]
MSYAWREIIPTQTGVFSAAWIIDAPWAHPVWSQYLLALYDLTTPAPEVGTVVFMPGATHEFVLHALDPERLILKDAPIHGTGESLHREDDQRERNGELREGLGPPGGPAWRRNRYELSAKCTTLYLGKK